MTGNHSALGRRVRRALATALLLPYLMLQALSSGIMPVATDDGLTFVICTGDEIVDAVLRPDGSYDLDGTADHSDGDACPWAIAHAVATLDADAPLVAFQAVTHPLMTVPAGDIVASFPTVRTPRARAPPRLA